MAIAPQYKLILEMNDGQMTVLNVHNEHPETSFGLPSGGEIWYEGYQEPDYIWQSSASTNDFEPKFSLSPLAFGTLKAAFYAMLIATPWRYVVPCIRPILWRREFAVRSSPLSN